MTPARLDLPIIPGATNRKPLWLLQPDFAYIPITVIQKTAPLRIIAPGHGLVDEYPAWFEGVTGWSALNSDKERQPPRLARVVDDDTIELNALVGIGQNASGGLLVYRRPVDLAGVTARLVLAGDSQSIELTTENGGLVIEGQGLLMIVLTAQQSAAINWQRGSYTLDLAMANGDVMRWLSGDVLVSNGGACNGRCT